MENNYETIQRVDGITYKRKKKALEYDSVIHIRISQNDIESLKEIANKKDIKYNQLIRNILIEYIEKEI